MKATIQFNINQHSKTAVEAVTGNNLKKKVLNYINNKLKLYLVINTNIIYKKNLTFKFEE